MAKMLSEGATQSYGWLNGYTTNAWMQAFERDQQYRANSANANVVPCPAEIFELYYKGGCTYSELADALRWAGVDVDQHTSPYSSSIFWNR